MKDQITALVIAVAEQIDEDHRVSSEGELSADTRLFGAGSLLDSLGLVTLIVELEQAIQEQLNVVVSLADEKALSQTRSPFRTIGTLAEYAAEQIEESNG
jgi:D-alanine--poly(phosphoribitol) ligase subunit 2